MTKVFGRLVGEFSNKDGSKTQIFHDGNSIKFVVNEQVTGSIPLEDADLEAIAEELDA